MGVSFSKNYPQWSLRTLRFPHLWGTETFFTIKEECFSNHPVPLSKEVSTFSPSPSSSGSGDVTALSADFSTSPSLLQGELHILTKPSLLEKGRM